MSSSPSDHQEKSSSKYPSAENPSSRHVLPTTTYNGKLKTKGIHPEGESGRSGIHPFHFFRVLWKSPASKVNRYLNFLWPFVPAAFVLYFLPVTHDRHRAQFATAYIGIIPAASLLDFAGNELAKKLPRVLGIVVETFFGGIVEIVLFMILIAKHQEGQHDYIPVIRAAILGSLLANLLLCLGGCFLVGGIKYSTQTFHKVISETGSGLLLVAGFALLIPSAFFSALVGHTTSELTSDPDAFTPSLLAHRTLYLSRVTSCVLIFAFFLFMVYNIFSHSSIFDEVLGIDEERDRDRDEDLKKPRLTLTEAVLTILFSGAMVSFMAYFLIANLEPLVVDYGLRDNFLGLILIPLAEKAAEHLSAIDEAYDNQINFALFHCLAPSIQTALFNAPLVVVVGWGLGKEMDLNFEIFFVVLLVLAILVVGNFLRDGASDYLEGALLLIVYFIIAVAAFFYPNPSQASTNGTATNETSESSNATAVTEHALRLAKRMIEAGLIPREL